MDISFCQNDLMGPAADVTGPRGIFFIHLTTCPYTYCPGDAFSRRSEITFDAKYVSS